MKTWLRFALAGGILTGAALLGWLIQNSSFGEGIELSTYDLRFKLRGPLGPPEKTPLTILAIDQASLDTLEEPLLFWHRYFAPVVDGLAHGGAASVGLDFLFSDVSRYPYAAPLQRDFVLALGRAKEKKVPIILGYKVLGTSVNYPPLQLHFFAGGLGYVNLTTDADDFVRRQELFSPSDGEETVPSFALALIREGLGTETVDVPSLPNRPRQMLVNFRGLQSYPMVSFLEAFKAAEEERWEFFEQFRGRIVLIGEVADEDRHPTPLYSWVDRAETRSNVRTAGVEIHAHTISTILEGDFIRQPEGLIQFLVILALALLITYVSFRFSPFIGIALSASVAIAYLLIVTEAFRSGYWIMVVGPFTAAIAAGGASQVANYVLEGREKRELRGLFQRYVDDNVIKQILETPDLELKGARRKITVMFSDIQGFTTRSESMPPEELVQHLNQYFEAMVSAIQGNRGLVDKFMGDGIMAIFGAPLPDDDSALHAVQAGQAMLKALGEVNRSLEERGIQPIGIGIGLHTGDAVVGNIGSTQKMEYTAIGDTVNVASRIEGLTRKYKTPLLISGQTFEELDGRISARFLADEMLKGKTQALTVYAVTAIEDAEASLIT